MRYENPIWPEYFADPFVLRSGGAYFAYGTGATPTEADGRAFPLLRSNNLVDWHYVGGALQPLSNSTANWAPEVMEHEGRFYMYYSAACGPSDEFHRIRVATADTPEGPFVDCGRELMGNIGFSIDPSPFRDPKSGQLYLFFALDYLSDEPYGTGLAVAKMKDMMTVASEPTLVHRATNDWQIYERQRNYKGRTWAAWYTVEGPSVVFHGNQYWCLYSGGRWSDKGYGVGFAVADSLKGPWKDDFAAHGPCVLQGIPGQVIGPGHCSTTLAPDSQSELIIYHAWNPEGTKRRMCMDPLLWTEHGPKCDGPSAGPRAYPQTPAQWPEG